MSARHLIGLDRAKAKTAIAENHYTRSIPSGKSVYFDYRGAVIVFSIPANQFIAKYLGFSEVWELSRLWASDGHPPNLLTEAISASVASFRRMFPKVEALVSYADPNAGHHGGVYRAASWIADGQSEEGRAYKAADGKIMARRAFHSGSSGMTKAEIEKAGFTETKTAGKIRFVKPLGGKNLRRWRKSRGEVSAEHGGKIAKLSNELTICVDSRRSP